MTNRNDLKMCSGRDFRPESGRAASAGLFHSAKNRMRLALPALAFAAVLAASARPSVSSVSFPLRDEGHLKLEPAPARLQPAVFAVKGGQGAIEGSIDFIHDVAAPFSLMLEETVARSESTLRDRLAALDFAREELRFSIGAHLMSVEEQAARLKSRLNNRNAAR